jgi:hypothetical protein
MNPNDVFQLPLPLFKTESRSTSTSARKWSNAFIASFVSKEFASNASAFDTNDHGASPTGTIEAHPFVVRISSSAS